MIGTQKIEIYVECTVPNCGWSKVFASRDEYLEFIIRWYDVHKHTDQFTFKAEGTFSIEKNVKQFRVGDVFLFKTREHDGKDGNPVTATGPSGQFAFFDKDIPLTKSLSPKHMVKGVIKQINKKSVIVIPLEDLGPMSAIDNFYPERY
jgi:hypothetical protein